MKKYLSKDFFDSTNQLIRKMKTTCIILIVFASSLFSANVKSQVAKVSLTVKNVSISAVIDAIESQTEYLFVYNRNEVEINRKVNVDVKDQSVAEVLSDIFSNMNVVYAMEGTNIMLMKKTVELAQQKSLSGRVTDNSGGPLPGVSVVIKGTTTGTITDSNGNYTLSNFSENPSLLFSFLGMKTQEVLIGNKVTINIVLEEESTGLDELVVVGYGTMKKSDLTGAISSIKNEDLTLSSNVNVTQMIQGKAAGVQIVQQSAQPGGGLSILIRGQASTNADNQPLYVIDGFPIYNEQIEAQYLVPSQGTKYYTGTRNPLNAINPNDIESIEILKDASATAIYGARAANGVVMITTKKGKNGVKVTFDEKFSTQKILQPYQMLNAEEFMNMFDQHQKQTLYAAKGIVPYGSKPETPQNIYKPRFPENVRQEIYNTVGKEGTNWFDLITRTGYIHEQNFSVSGGSEKTKFFSSINYFDQKGVVINSGLKRFSGRLNVDQELTSKIKMGINLTGSQIKNQNAQLGQDTWEQSGIISSALGFPPIYAVKDTLGNYTENKLYAANPNPVSFKEIQDNTLENRLLGTAFLEFKIIEGLTFRPSVGFDNATSDHTLYLPNTFKFGAAEGGVAFHGNNKASSTLFDMVFNYNKLIGKNHSVNAIAGYSYQNRTRDGLSVRNTGFFTDAFGADKIQSGLVKNINESSKSASTMASYFSRVNYTYKSKYLFTLTGRLDGSDRFGINNKYGFFPSAALGWNLAKENFMSSLSMISNLKLRVSAGQTGNASIGESAFAYYGPNTVYLFGIKDPQTGMVKTQQENPNLKWETTTEYNTGFDFGLFNDRISGSFEYFNKVIDGLLYQQTLQIYQQVEKIFMNVGKTQSHGFEFGLNANILTGKLKWSANLNLSRYIDRWKERSPEAIASLPDYMAINDYMRPLYNFVPDHIMQIGENPQPFPNDEVNTFIPGNLIVKDLDGWERDDSGNYLLNSNTKRIRMGAPDGKIDEADMVLQGDFNPKLIFGFGSTFKYKGFDLSLFFNGQYKYWINNEQYNFYTGTTEFLYGGWNRSKDFLNVWTPDNSTGTIPAMPKYKHYYMGWNTLAYQQISFLRLKNITLGYNFPYKILGTRVRIYADATNLLTFTNLKGGDPETFTYHAQTQYGNTGSGLNAYPNQKSYTMGVSVDF